MKCNQCEQNFNISQLTKTGLVWTCGSCLLSRAQQAEAENGRLREALLPFAQLSEQMCEENQPDNKTLHLRYWNDLNSTWYEFFRNQKPFQPFNLGHIRSARAALAAQAPETGEREAVTEALLQWAASPEEDWLYWDFEEQKYFCAFCGNTNLHYREVIHTDSCLHLRAKTLRAQAGGE